jgi:hypothetical protein
MTRRRLIRLNTQTTGHGTLRVSMESPYATDFINKYYKVVKDISKDNQVLTNMAWFVIDKADEEGLIPYQGEYELRKTANKSEYNKFYSMQKEGKTKKRVYWKDTTFKDSDDNSPKFWHHTHEVNSWKKEKVTIKASSVHSKNDFRNETGATPRNTFNKLLRKKLVDFEIGSRMKPITYTRGNRKAYADRPPHLSDVDITHTVIINGQFVGIKIYAKKKPDKKFKGGEFTSEYGLLQYTSDDTNWKRHTQGTTSYWLHAVLGVNKNGKGINSPNAKQNYEQLREYMQKALREKVKRGG